MPGEQGGCELPALQMDAQLCLAPLPPSSRGDLETRMVVLLGPHVCHTLKAEKIRYLI